MPCWPNPNNSQRHHEANTEFLMPITSITKDLESLTMTVVAAAMLLP